MTKLNALWRIKRFQIKKRPAYSGSPKRLIIIPSDPWTLTGAKGDEAMIQSVVSQLRAAEPMLTVGIVTATKKASEAATQLGFQPVEIWDSGFIATLDAIDAFNPDALAVLGADCMDGYYNPHTTLRLIATADIAARKGVRSTLLGFSFNEHPNAYLRSAFNRVTPKLAINVRDNISLGRFNRFCKAQATLVTDSAFMLEPDTTSINVEEASAWIQTRRKQGDAVIGFNIHPMLLKDRTDSALATINCSAISALRQFMTEKAVSIVLISHDYRGQDGDDTCLHLVYSALKEQFSEQLRYTTTQLTAAELKGIAGMLDGVVTGRMHLAIASLGMGVPVAALTYQDKFQGLMDHFGFPHSLLLPPTQLKQSTHLHQLLTDFCNSLDDLKDLTRQALPKVRIASQENISRLLKNT